MSLKNDFKNHPVLFSLFGLALLFVASVIMVICSLIYSAANQSKTVLDIKKVDYGTVVKVSNCRSLKLNIYCNVQTDKYSFNSLNVRDYPGDDMLYAGDKIFKEIWTFEDRVETRLGRNGYTTPSGVCYNWMSCRGVK